MIPLEQLRHTKKTELSHDDFEEHQLKMVTEAVSDRIQQQTEALQLEHDEKASKRINHEKNLISNLL